MGKGTDSFKSELGKNTAKWVSNIFFGDGHSTPYRTNVKVEKLQLELKKQKKENNLISRKIRYLNNNENKTSLEYKKEEIITTKVPNNKNEIMDFSYFLFSVVKVYGWKSDENEKGINSLSDVCLVKLEQCLMKLNLYNNTEEANLINKEIKNLKKKRFFQKNMVYIGLGLFFLVALVLLKLGVIK